VKLGQAEGLLTYELKVPLAATMRTLWHWREAGQ
jgi:hypothetical protein